MRVTFHQNEFRVSCKAEERHLAKKAGFVWNEAFKVWYTEKPGVAARLREYFDDKAKEQYARYTVVESPWRGGPIPYPKHLRPFDFQLTAAEFALARSRSYLALDPGLGKTIVASLIQNATRNPALYICPPFLVENTKAEFEKWTDERVETRIDPARILRNQRIYPHFWVLPDSMLQKDEPLPWGRKPSERAEKLRARNAEMLCRIKEFIRFHKSEGRPITLFVDEAHRFKSDTAKRTKALFYFMRQFDRVVFLSGTPMPNRPIELYPVLSQAAPGLIDHMNKYEYGARFCEAYKSRFGWDFSGAANVAELRDRIMGKFMLRYRKTDVLKELPEKTEELLLIGEDMSPKVAELNQRLLRKFSPEDLMGYLAPNDHIVTYRRELGKAKVKYVAPIIKSILEETDESLLVFAIHKEVIRDLVSSLKKFSPLVITGDVPSSERQDIVHQFQTSAAHRLFIGNIQAAGVGFTLTKASRVLFAEFSWVPADNDQASDRAHRIGQQSNVYCQYAVFKDSVDRAVMETILRKKKVTQHI